MKSLRKLSKNQLTEIRDKLEDLCTRLGYNIIYGQGDFKDGTCLVQSERKIVINKFTPLDLQVEFLVKILVQLDLKDVYILPEIRRLIEEQNS